MPMSDYCPPRSTCSVSSIHGSLHQSRANKTMAGPLNAPVKGRQPANASVPTHSYEALGEGCAGPAVLGDDGIGLGGPDEGFGVLVAMFDPVGDRGLEVGHGGKGATADALSGDLGKQPFDEVEPRRGSRREV